MGLATKAFIPWFVDEDFACKVLDDSGNATTDDTDDNGKPAPDVDSAKCKCPEFAKAILVPVDLVLLPSLTPIHALAICDVATEPKLTDHFLPNAETGPPVRIALGATTAFRAVWLLGTVDTVARFGRFPLAFLSYPQQPPPIIIAETGTIPCSLPLRSSV